MDPGAVVVAALGANGAAVDDNNLDLVVDATVGKAEVQYIVAFFRQYFIRDESNPYARNVDQLDTPYMRVHVVAERGFDF